MAATTLATFIVLGTEFSTRGAYIVLIGFIGVCSMVVLAIAFVIPSTRKSEPSGRVLRSRTG